MFYIQQLTWEPARPERVLTGNEHGELPVDDPPPVEHPSERYSAWKSSAIFDLQPFSSPGGR
jgi:hypothetical protein